MERSWVENHVSPDGWNIQSGRQWRLQIREGDLENNIRMGSPASRVDVYYACDHAHWPGNHRSPTSLGTKTNQSWDLEQKSSAWPKHTDLSLSECVIKTVKNTHLLHCYNRRCNNTWLKVKIACCIKKINYQAEIRVNAQQVLLVNPQAYL